MHTDKTLNLLQLTFFLTQYDLSILKNFSYTRTSIENP